MKITKYWSIILLVFPCIFGWLGYNGQGFIFKAAVAGSGIFLLSFLNRRSLCSKCDIWFIIIAFAFSITGDWFLSTRHGSSARFVYGIAFFFLAHTGYLAYSLFNGRIKWIFTFILLAFYLAFYIFLLLPSIHEPALDVAVLGYLIISCFSVGAAAGIESLSVQKWIYFFGITMILFSDTIIGLSEFTTFREWNFLILPTYYLAQISITMALMIKNLVYKA
jgi:uncharacterized membrane protein YhhN